MMPTNFVGLTGDGPGVEDAVRPEAAAGVMGPLPGAVGVHRHQPPGEGVRDVGVFPARVEDAAVGHHRGIEVVVLIEAQPAHARAVGVASRRSWPPRRTAARTAPTGNRPTRRTGCGRRAGSRSRSCRRRSPRRASPGGGPCRRRRSRRSASGRDCRPRRTAAGRRRSAASGRRRRPGFSGRIERREPPLGPDGREHGDLVVDRDLAQEAVALEVDRQAVEEPDRRRCRNGIAQTGAAAVICRASLRFTSSSRSKSRSGLASSASARSASNCSDGLQKSLEVDRSGRRVRAASATVLLQFRDPPQVLRPLGVPGAEGLGSGPPRPAASDWRFASFQRAKRLFDLAGAVVEPADGVEVGGRLRVAGQLAGLARQRPARVAAA